MSHSKITLSPVFIISIYCLLTACSGARDQKSPVSHQGKAEKPVASFTDGLKDLIASTLNHGGKLNDSVELTNLDLIDSTYNANQYEPIWSKQQHWLPLGDSLFRFIEHSKEFGLFPSDYHFPALAFVHRVFEADSIGRKNLLLWERADLILTDAFFTLVRHLKQGRLSYDSVTLRTDTVLVSDMYRNALESALQTGSIAGPLHSLEPRYKGYDSLRAYIGNFLLKAEFKPYTYLKYPYSDSVSFFKLVEKRLHEVGELSPEKAGLDTLAFQKIFRKYQKDHGLKITSRLSDQLVDRLNQTDWEKFKKIAVNLDRYKQLPDTLPATRAWVNLPAYTLDVFNSDTLVFQSRVIVGGPNTRTPLLTSEISNFITFPQWTVPFSIIMKEMLPKIQQNVEFLTKENLMVVDSNDSIIDPNTVKWAKLNKNHFPYLLKQRQGDDNSLGVIKFNFRNKYSVYMHDTNVRGKFNNAYRAISHGCVRVKDWSKLANFLTRNDTLRYHPDTLTAWIKRQEKHMVSGFLRLPLYFRYFTCEGKDGRIKFYDDIYEEDRYLREKYFADKVIQ